MRSVNRKTPRASGKGVGADFGFVVFIGIPSTAPTGRCRPGCTCRPCGRLGGFACGRRWLSSGDRSGFCRLSPPDRCRCSGPLAAARLSSNDPRAATDSSSACRGHRSQRSRIETLHRGFSRRLSLRSSHRSRTSPCSAGLHEPA